MAFSKLSARCVHVAAKIAAKVGVDYAVVDKIPRTWIQHISLITSEKYDAQRRQ